MSDFNMETRKHHNAERCKCGRDHRPGPTCCLPCEEGRGEHSPLCDLEWNWNQEGLKK